MEAHERKEGRVRRRAVVLSGRGSPRQERLVPLYRVFSREGPRLPKEGNAPARTV